MTVSPASAQAERPYVPFLKWAGGKRWLAPYLRTIASETKGKYIEPFVGSGAVYFSLAPRRALLTDVNKSLIETFECVRDSPDLIADLLSKHHKLHSPAYYYAVRSMELTSPVERAASFIYLNRTCWNGLYRVNKKGKFNVPIGTKTSAILETDDWEKLSQLLSGAKLLSQDFETTVDSAVRGDVIFADPPYTVKHNLNGFIKYNESLFSWEDQIRLRDSLVRAKRRGVTIYATNADHQSVRDLYSPHFDVEALERASVLSGDPQYRGRFNELFISFQ